MVRLLLSVLILFVCSPLAASVLVIESYHKEYGWDSRYRQAIKETLATHYLVNFFEMDTKRLPPEQHQQRAELAWQTYLSLKPQLVILGDDNALRMLGHRFGKTTTPVVYLGINNNPRDYNIHRYPNITGVLERPLLKRSILSIKKILPRANSILVMFDSGPTSQASVEGIFSGKRLLHSAGVTTELKLNDTWRQWQESILNASKQGFDAIAIGLYHTLVDAQGKHIDANEVIKWTSAHSTLPLFAFWDFAVGQHKTLGGLVLEGYDQGSQAAQLTLKILQGTPPNQLRPITSNHGRYIYSRSQLNRFDLTLPPDIQQTAILVD